MVGGAGRAGGAAGGREGGCKRECLFWMDPIGVVIRYALTPGPLRALVISNFYVLLPLVVKTVIFAGEYFFEK